MSDKITSSGFYSAGMEAFLDKLEKVLIKALLS